MAYYDALIAKWATLAPGTAAEKLAALNAEVVTGSAPVAFAVSAMDVHNAMVLAEFKALSAANQQLMRDMFALPGDIPAGAGTFARAVILDLFPAGSATRANFVALARAERTPWWRANGYTSPFNENDLAAAGGLT